VRRGASSITTSSSSSSSSVKPKDQHVTAKLTKTASVIWWSEFLAIDPGVRVRFPALPDFLRTGPTQPREYYMARLKRKYLLLCIANEGKVNYK
jgi:hypothetical protein